jgi:hypothetical protein
MRRTLGNRSATALRTGAGKVTSETAVRATSAPGRGSPSTRPSPKMALRSSTPTSTATPSRESSTAAVPSRTR